MKKMKKEYVREEVRLKCKKCQHEWPYHGGRLGEIGHGYTVRICCPRCRSSNVNLEKDRVKKSD